MSVERDETPDGPVPRWNLADRLIKSRDFADVSQADMADYLGLSRAAISDFETGRRVPRLAYLRVWATRCGVSYPWLVDEGGEPPGGHAQSRCTWTRPQFRRSLDVLPLQLWTPAADHAA